MTMTMMMTMTILDTCPNCGGDLEAVQWGAWLWCRESDEHYETDEIQYPDASLSIEAVLERARKIEEADNG